MAINKNDFIKSIKQGVKDVGTVFNPVTAYKSVKQDVKNAMAKDKANYVDRSMDTYARKKHYEENKERIDEMMNKEATAGTPYKKVELKATIPGANKKKLKIYKVLD